MYMYMFLPPGHSLSSCAFQRFLPLGEILMNIKDEIL